MYFQIIFFSLKEKHNKIIMSSTNYDLYKYISEFSSATVSMGLLDYILYSKNM